jgi:uncharacterized integral membrane protein (TIGR00698 family)
MTVVPGFLLALALALGGQYLSEFVGVDLMGLPRSPISAIMMAILLGILVRNTVRLPELFNPGIRFGLVRMLRIGIVLLGIRLSLGEVGAIGLKSLPIIIGAVAAALLSATWLCRRMCSTSRLGTLIALGTSICGATAIVAIAPAIAAEDDEVAYSVACVTLFGIIAMLSYPFFAHWIFDADSFKSGLFLGTSVHVTAPVAGAGLVYQEYYSDPETLNVATVTKLVRNLGMLAIIPLMSVFYHRSHTDGTEGPKWWTMIPLFVVGFACMSLVRTIGDIGDQPFGLLTAESWNTTVGYVKQAAEFCLGIAMAAVGLGTRIRKLVSIGLKPLGAGFVSAVIVGGASVTLISVLY